VVRFPSTTGKQTHVPRASLRTAFSFCALFKLPSPLGAQLALGMVAQAEKARQSPNPPAEISNTRRLVPDSEKAFTLP